MRPYVTLFSSSGYINDMANGSICLALGWSGDINIARQRAIEGKTGQNIAGPDPEDRRPAVLRHDGHPGRRRRTPATRTSSSTTSCAPRCTPSLTNKVFYANPNMASKKFIKPEVANNPTVFLPPADMKKMRPPDALTNDLRRLMTRTYTGFKTGL